MPNLEHYKGREQAYIKHSLIEKYLTRFIIKIGGSNWNKIVYIDAFAGPWGSNSEDYSDTSFGVALNKINEGLKSLRNIGKALPKVEVVLIEKDPEAFEKLEEFVENHENKEIKLKCLNGAFEDIVPVLRKGLSDTCFKFFLMDPKGWSGLSMNIIKPLISGRSSEVLVNVMTDFIRRFSTVESCQDSYKDFFGREGVSDEIANAASEDREDVIVREYMKSLKVTAGFKYVSSCVVLQPDKNGIKYFMVYATNSPVGIKVFKDAERQASSLQDNLKWEKENEGQLQLFQQVELPPVTQNLREKYKKLASAKVEALFHNKSKVPYDDVFCAAMEFPLVTPAELIDFLKTHQTLRLKLNGKKRKKPQLDKGDKVIKTN